MTRFASVGFAVAVLCAAAEVLSGPGARFGVWDFRLGFSILKWAAYGGLAGAGLSLLALRARPSAAVCAIVIGLAAYLVPSQLLRSARRYPPIHDISTDTQDPPRFVAILPLRQKALNPAEYGGPEIAAQQRAAYPDISPIDLKVPPAEAYKKAAAAARSLGWRIAAEDPHDGRIEATDTTFWFGFKDDVVVRIRPSAAGSRVDIRSVSRVGKGDVGVNAARIRRFLQSLRP